MTLTILERLSYRYAKRLSLGEIDLPAEIGLNHPYRVLPMTGRSEGSLLAIFGLGVQGIPEKR